MFFFIVLISFSLIATILYNFQEPLRHTLPDPRPQNVDLSLKEITLTNSHEGATSWRLIAETADFDIGTKSGWLKNVRLVFFNKDKGDMELTADKGEVGADGSSFRAIGNVTLKGSEGYTLFCDDLEYSQKDSLIRTESPVRIVDERMELRGRGLKYHVEERLFELLNDIEADVHDRNGLQG
ncbi:MAG: LPS export ABC transporter periplasmic protein LptC [Desulfuromonadaceae bacterium]|nr:LPS export ABC transporter periplasmic protein LptC [Desulfuromonadaceae bacterium]